jgi:hypothetical protein
MVQGLWQKINIIRRNLTQTDSYGGAISNDNNYVYYNVPAAIAIFRPNQQSRSQGLETDVGADLTIAKMFGGEQIQIKERDEIEVVCPETDYFYDKRFRIVGIQPSKRPTSIGHIHCTLSRIEYSRSKQ